MKLLTLILMGIVISAPALACGSEGKIEISLKKPESDRKECIALYLEFPDHFGIYDKAELTLVYNDGAGRLLDVDLQVNDYEKDDGKLTTRFCLTEDVLKHSSIAISWDHINEHGFSQTAFCNLWTDTGNLYELLEVGTKLVAPSDI